MKQPPDTTHMRVAKGNYSVYFRRDYRRGSKNWYATGTVDTNADIPTRGGVKKRALSFSRQKKKKTTTKRRYETNKYSSNKKSKQPEERAHYVLNRKRHVMVHTAKHTTHVPIPRLPYIPGRSA